MKYFDSRVFILGMANWPCGCGPAAYPKNAAALPRYIRHMSDISDIRIDAHGQKYPHDHP